MTTQDRDAAEYTDAQKLELLAAWFDMWDNPDTDRRAILDDERFPGKNDVQRDLRRIAAVLSRESTPEPGLREALADVARWVSLSSEPGADVVLASIDAALRATPGDLQPDREDVKP